MVGVASESDALPVSFSPKMSRTLTGRADPDSTGSAKRLGLGSSTWLAMINANYIRLRLNAAAFGALRSNYTLAKKDSWAINALQRALEAAKEVIKVQLLKFTPDVSGNQDVRASIGQLLWNRRLVLMSSHSAWPSRSYKLRRC